MDILTANDKVGEYPNSYYAATANLLDPFPAAAGELKCDACIIGAGYTGLSSALHLVQKGYDVILLEAVNSSRVVQKHIGVEDECFSHRLRMTFEAL